MCQAPKNIYKTTQYVYFQFKNSGIFLMNNDRLQASNNTWHNSTAHHVESKKKGGLGTFFRRKMKPHNMQDLNSSIKNRSNTSEMRNPGQPKTAAKFQRGDDRYPSEVSQFNHRTINTHSGIDGMGTRNHVPPIYSSNSYLTTINEWSPAQTILLSEHDANQYINLFLTNFFQQVSENQHPKLFAVLPGKSNQQKKEHFLSKTTLYKSIALSSFKSTFRKDFSRDHLNDFLKKEISYMLNDLLSSKFKDQFDKKQISPNSLSTFTRLRSNLEKYIANQLSAIFVDVENVFFDKKNHTLDIRNLSLDPKSLLNLSFNNLSFKETDGHLHIPATENPWLDMISLRNELLFDSSRFNFYDLSGAGSNCWLRAAWSLIFNFVENKQLVNLINDINNDKLSLISDELNQANFDKSAFLRINKNAKTDLSSVFDDGVLTKNEALPEVNRQRRLCYRNQDASINNTVSLEEHLQLLTKYILQKIVRSNDSNKRKYGDGFIDLMLSPNSGAPALVIYDILAFFKIDFNLVHVNRALRVDVSESLTQREKLRNQINENESGIWICSHSQGYKNSIVNILSGESTGEKRLFLIPDLLLERPIAILNTSHFNIVTNK